MGSGQSTQKKEGSRMSKPLFGIDGASPTSGKGAEELDRLVAELPSVIDDESRQQVEDYRQACDNGKGPMVACFATGEYLALFEQKHSEAAELYRNVCFRDKKDKSPNGVLIDGTKAYPAGCFNLAKMTMTGKGGVKVDNGKAYQMFDRACRAGHGGACYIQAQLLTQEPGALGPGVPFDPDKAMQLYEKNCTDLGDSVSCFTLASLLLRGVKVSLAADNVSPQEARGMESLKKRQNEQDRSRQPDETFSVPRDPLKAERLLKIGCDRGSHVTSCHNLAVMYKQGDDGVPADEEKAKIYAKKTESMIQTFGGF
ncbi:hypothetical protein ACA910_005054 [Epithemia clementina (nom. ined.)]